MLELRTRDRERKLLRKIEQSIASIDAGDYGYCAETGEPIGVVLARRPPRCRSSAAAPRLKHKDVRGLIFRGRPLPVAQDGPLAAKIAAMEHTDSSIFYGTTIVCVRRQTPQGMQVAIGGDGQVTLGNIVVRARRARCAKALPSDQVLASFARRDRRRLHAVRALRGQARKHQGHLVRAAIELTKDWRTDRVLRRPRPCWRWPTGAPSDHHRQWRRARA